MVVQPKIITSLPADLYKLFCPLDKSSQKPFVVLRICLSKRLAGCAFCFEAFAIAEHSVEGRDCVVHLAEALDVGSLVVSVVVFIVVFLSSFVGSTAEFSKERSDYVSDLFVIEEPNLGCECIALALELLHVPLYDPRTAVASVTLGIVSQHFHQRFGCERPERTFRAMVPMLKIELMTELFP